MEKKIRVLFVDDEQSILDGLRRKLRSYRKDWRMIFASGGREALEIMKDEHFDIIVTDMRMPDIDGVKLLKEVKTLYPHMVRIILSGYSDMPTIFQVVNIAHQFLAKPTDTNEVASVIEQAYRIRTMLNNKDLINLASNMTSLPSIPTLLVELQRELQSSASSMRRVGEIISRDISMTAKIMKLVNSAFFGLPHPITDPVIAVNLLGLNTVVSLVLSVHIFSEFDIGEEKGFSLERIMEHSLGTAAYAQKIAGVCSTEKYVADFSFIAGMLHDVGKILFIGNVPEEYAAIIELSKKHDIPLIEAEQTASGATHAELGAYLLGLWGLPYPVIEALAYHHRPSVCIDRGFLPLTAVHVANAIETAFNNDCIDRIQEMVDMEYLEGIGMVDQLPKWVELCSTIARKGEK